MSKKFDKFVDEHYDDIRDAYKERLRDMEYPEYLLDETNDGWDEFCKEYYYEYTG